MTREQAQQILGEIAEYLEAFRKDPQSTTFVPLCDAYLSLGMLNEALSVARQGVGALPLFGPGYVALGRAQKRCGELDSALQSFSHALEVDPDNVAALENLAMLYVLLGDKAQSCSLLVRAVELSPEDPVLANLHRSLQSLAHEADSARRDQGENVCATADEPVFATATVADLYVKQGCLDKALGIYRELLQAQPDDLSLKDRLAHVECLLAEQSASEAISTSEASDTTVVDTISQSPCDVIAVLQSWLSAIQARREHVQKHIAGHC